MKCPNCGGDKRGNCPTCKGEGEIHRVVRSGELVTTVKTSLYHAGVKVSLSEQVQALLREKAPQYGVTPQEIANQACEAINNVSLFEEVIRRYAEAL